VGGWSGEAVVIDLDPLGPGVDRVLGVEFVDGVRWESLGHTTGRLGARALRESLPRRHGVAALSWSGAAASRGFPGFTAREVLSAARRGHDTVVLDLPRAPDPSLDELVARCDHVLVTLRTTVPGIASAMRVCGRFADPGRVGLVVRGAAVDDESLSRVVGAPVVVRMADQRGLAESIDLGLGPVRSRRGPLGRAAAEVLAALTARGGG
jgi:secretion/DNA translocation related CpaE-like protein